MIVIEPLPAVLATMPFAPPGDNAERTVDADISGSGGLRNSRRYCVTRGGHDSCLSGTLTDNDADSIDGRGDSLGDGSRRNTGQRASWGQAGQSAWPCSRWGTPGQASALVSLRS